jgi:hypothetical protein
MPAPDRRDLTPSSALPLAYFSFAHLALGGALMVLIVRPDIPGTFFYHPRMIALVHAVTLGWISASILGAFYVVAPLALRMPMTVGRLDWAAYAAFVLGVIGMTVHLWMGDYDRMLPDAVVVTIAFVWVAARAWRGLRSASVPWPIALHVGLAFGNILAAALLGMMIGLERTQGLFGIPILAATYAHAHVAAVGWAALMVVGLGYRLIPMILPAAMPTGWSLAVSAVLIEAGLLVVVFGWLGWPLLLPVGATTIVAGLAAFAWQMRRTLAHRLPRPPALPRRDWSAWQAQVSLGWLVVAAALGLVLSFDLAGDRRTTVQWVYGVAGLVGFLTQVVVGMQGRLVPLYAWYRAMDARGGTPPAVGANDLPKASFARVVFITWAVGVPLLAWGLAGERVDAIRAGSVALMCGVSVGFVYLRYLMRTAMNGTGMLARRA